jgi:ABC-2 type transport system ATP-binding protein
MEKIDLIEARGISKSFGRFRAVREVSLNIRRSEIYGFLGLNGAGKTTTIRMLLGMIKPSSGEVFINGTQFQPGRKSMWERVGYMVETPHAYPDLTVRENLEIVRRWRKLKDTGIVDEIINRLGLKPWANRCARTLSLGNAQRLGLAKALIHHPDLLILDEPANGLDPAGIVEIRHLLRGLAEKEGVTVFISSHILSEVAKLATRIGVIHEGLLIKEFKTRELQEQEQQRLVVTARDPGAALLVLEKAGIKAEIDRNQSLIITEKHSIQNPDRVATLMVQAGYPPTGLMVEQRDLESYFLQLIGPREAKI